MSGPSRYAIAMLKARAHRKNAQSVKPRIRKIRAGEPGTDTHEGQVFRWLVVCWINPATDGELGFGFTTHDRALEWALTPREET